MKYLISIFAGGFFFLSSCKKDKNNITITPAPSDAKTRVYCIAAEEVVWDYAPQDSNVFMGMAFDGNEQSKVFKVIAAKV